MLLEALAASLAIYGVTAGWCSPDALDDAPSDDVWIVEEDGDDSDLLDAVRRRSPTTWYVVDFRGPRSDAPPVGAAGRISVDAPIADVSQLLRAPAAQPADAVATPSPLSPREVQVLSAMASGATQQEISDALCVSVQTVRTHVQNAMGKLGAHSRREALAIAAERGWLRRMGTGDQT
jgi:DNA-binding CsgD family transcriptional regulator